MKLTQLVLDDEKSKRTFSSLLWSKLKGKELETIVKWGNKRKNISHKKRLIVYYQNDLTQALSEIDKKYVPKEEVEWLGKTIEGHEMIISKQKRQLIQKDKEIEVYEKGINNMLKAHKIDMKEQLSSSIPIKEVEEMIKEIDEATESYEPKVIDKGLYKIQEAGFNTGLEKAKQII